MFSHIGSEPENGSHATWKDIRRWQVKNIAGVVNVRVPKNARLERLDTPVGEIKYVRFPFSVNGGNVYAHVRHDDPMKFRGLHVTARLELWVKEKEDRKEFYLDFFPTEEGVTHIFSVIPSKEVPPRFRRAGLAIAYIPEPKTGLIVIANVR